MCWRRAREGVQRRSWLLERLRGCWLRGCWLLLLLLLRDPPGRTRRTAGPRCTCPESRVRPRPWRPHRGSEPEGPEDEELWGSSPQRWLMFNAGAAGAATTEPVLKVVRFVPCVSLEDR